MVGEIFYLRKRISDSVFFAQTMPLLYAVFLSSLPVAAIILNWLPVSSNYYRSHSSKAPKVT